MVSGIIGVPLGTYLAQKLKKKSHRYDAIICAGGLLISAPLLASSMLMVTADETLAYVLVFFGEVALNLNWAIVADILLVRFTKHTQHTHTLNHNFFLNISIASFKEKFRMFVQR